MKEVGLTDVAVAAPVPDHGVLLFGLELVATLEVRELVGPEVDAPVHHRARLEGARDLEERLGHALDECLLFAPLEQPARVHTAQGVGDHELGPQKSDTVDRQCRNLGRVLGERQVDVDPGGERSSALFDVGGTGLGHLDRGGHGTFCHQTLGTVDRHQLAVAQDGRGVACTYDSGYAELPRDDGGMAGHSATVGDHRCCSPHGGHPVRARHRGDEHVAGLETMPLMRRLQHTHHP